MVKAVSIKYKRIRVSQAVDRASKLAVERGAKVEKRRNPDRPREMRLQRDLFAGSEQAEGVRDSSRGFSDSARKGLRRRRTREEELQSKDNAEERDKCGGHAADLGKHLRPWRRLRASVDLAPQVHDSRRRPKEANLAEGEQVRRRNNDGSGPRRLFLQVA